MDSMDAGQRRFLATARGFTVLELMIALAVAAVIAGVAIPSFSESLNNSRRAAAVNALVVALNYARSEAIARHRPVTVCRSRSGTECDTDGDGWHQGWIVFGDDDADGQRSIDEAIMRRHEALGGGISLHGNSNLQRRVTFRSAGNTGNNGRIAYCDRRGWSPAARIVVVATTGRVRSISPQDDPNAALAGCTP